MSDAPPEGASPSPIDPCPIDPWLLERLVCPVTRAPLRWDGQALVSDAAGRAYPVRQGVPVLLPEAGVPVQ